MSGGEDKRFEATPARRRRARQEGNVARSAEITSLAAFAGAVFSAIIAVPLVAAASAAAVREAAAHPLQRDAARAVLAVAAAALVPALAAACAGTAAALAQAGGLHVTAVRADPKRLDPLAGLKRMLGGETVVALLRAALAFAAALAAMAPVAREAVAGAVVLGSPAFHGSAGVSPASYGAAAVLVATAALRACGAALAVGAAFAVADYALARRRWLRGLRMSFDELKRDAKENDGDPHARARRKSTHRTIVRGAVGRTREASFVVVNPTHVAVALRYAPPAVPVPEILVRALDDVALRVRAIAREHRIPLIEDVALARLLYAQGETGRAIPPDAYVAVAQIVAALAREGLLA
jgi:flagellar biosynthesis protein FlhB